MNLYLTHFIFQAKILIRTPAFLIPTIIFPTMLYCFLGGTGIALGNEAFIFSSLAIYGVFGIGVYQFAASIASERENPFTPWQKTLYNSHMPMFMGRILMALVFALIALSLLFAVAPLVSTLNLGLEKFIKIFLVALTAIFPSILAGMSIGYLCSPRTAIAIANLIFLPLAFLGGLLINPNIYTGFMATLSKITITRQFGEIAWSIVGEHPMPNETLWIIASYTIILALFVWFSIKRDQNKRFG